MFKDFFKFMINRVLFFVIALFAFTLTIFITFLYTFNQKMGLLLGGVFLIAIIFFIFLFYKWIFIPYKETKKILNMFINGFTVQGVYDLRNPLSPEIDAAFNKLKETYLTHELINATKKQAQYLALQNQINPHFLYNTLESIRSEALIAKLNTVADMTEALGNFFRYTISNMEHLVYLEDELMNIENYYLIQKYRFGDRISYNTIYRKEERETLLKYMIPKLTLQPIVENAIYHGIERKVENGHITIKIESTEKRLIVTVSDDGIGMNDKELNKLTQKLNSWTLDYINQNDEEKGGIAIVNVNNRIKLLFGEAYGISIFSTLGLGTDVEITLPLKKDSDL